MQRVADDVSIRPKDLEEEVAQALKRAGVDFDEVFERCCAVSMEWKYDACKPFGSPSELGKKAR